MIPATKETNMIDLESNSRKKASQSKRPRRLIKDSAYGNELSAIDVRDSAAEDGVALQEIILLE